MTIPEPKYPLSLPGRHPAFYFPDWHRGAFCTVALVTGPSGVWVWCETCRVACQLDAISMKIAVEHCGEDKER